MYTNNMKLERFEAKLSWIFATAVFLLLLVGLLLLVAGFAGSSVAQESQPRTFASAGEATNALYEAAQGGNEQALEAILGAGKEVTSSSDEVEDKLEREQFSQKYKEMHRLVREDNGTTVLYIGAENWPFPVPLVEKNGAWYFDSKTGTEEITFRRVGENETAAIEVCEEFAIGRTNGTKVKSAKSDSEDPITRYAQGLATAGAVSDDVNGSAPFHGYYFRRSTGNSDADAAKDTSVGKRRGVILIAYPSDYGSSGVKTFIVTRGGIVYEKDLGPNTTTAAPTIKSRTSSWHASN